MKLCIICRQRPAEVPDREVMGRPIKKICKQCHAKRLQNDLNVILDRRIKMKYLLLLLLPMLVGCTTMPQRTIESYTWDGNSTRTMVRVHEEGAQLFFGERHDSVATEKTFANSDIDKKTVGSVAMTAIGAFAGGQIAGPIGVVAGGAAGYGTSIALDKKTTDTVPAVGAIKLMKSRATPVEAMRSEAISSEAISPETLKTLAPKLKAYIQEHPEACKLVPILGEDKVMALIDQLIGGS